MFWRQYGVGRTKQGIWASRKDGKVFFHPCHFKRYVGSDRTSDPIALHFFDAFWPINFF